MNSSKKIAKQTLLSKFKRFEFLEGHAFTTGMLYGLTNDLDATHINEAVAELVAEGIVEETKDGIILTKKGELSLY